ncbi:SAM-dependent methyltransferase [Sphaerimonospora cavernae]|uniref:SAM-dependent methyltransferase n=1 Tax=Sphaerimonospora cavernae TaxID=1740611 RepID=A0ABV6U7M8_9ACTN
MDHNPIRALVHARALLARDAQTRAILRDVRRPEEILTDRDLVHLLDLSRPVAVLLVAVLHFIPDEHDAYAAVRTLVDAMAPGSFLVVSHVEQCPELEAAVRHYKQANAPAVPRSVDEIARFFDDLDLISPGLVNVQRWRPDDQKPCLDGDVPCYGGIGVKR